MVEAILHGFILALGLILPLGVQNLFVFNQGALHSRLTRSLPAVITASLCDTLLISLATLGVSVVVLEYVWIKTMLYMVGICFLIYMGYTTWTTKPTGQERSDTQSFSPQKQIVFALSVSLLNPHAILDTVGVVGTSSLKYAGGEKTAFTVSCILVSWVWFTGLAIAGKTAGKLDASGKLLSLVNIISAMIMWGTAVYLAFGLIPR